MGRGKVFQCEVTISSGVRENLFKKHNIEIWEVEEVVFDKTRPDGTLQKLLDVSRLTSLGWKPKISLKDGIRSTYDSFKKI